MVKRNLTWDPAIRCNVEETEQNNIFGPESVKKLCEVSKLSFINLHIYMKHQNSSHKMLLDLTHDHLSAAISATPSKRRDPLIFQT